MSAVELKGDALLFRIYVQPKSSKNVIAGLHADPLKGDALKVKITAPPVDGAANTMCIKFFAKLLGVSKSSLEIVSGHTARTKRLRVTLQQTLEGRKKRDEIKTLLESYT